MKFISKRLILFVLLFVFSGFHFAHAGIIINEVELSPIENRFIELYNQDGSSVDLTGWYIQRKTQAGSSFSSLVSKTNFENKKINAGGYFLISRIKLDNSDIVSDNLTLTESNIIQIKNGNGEVVNTICWGDVIDCAGNKASNPSEGQSIQMSLSGSLAIGNPTPGIQNFVSSSVSQNNNTSGVPDVSTTVLPAPSLLEVKTKIIETPKIKTKITAKNVGFTNLPFSLEVNTLGLNGERLSQGKYFWNFGDGDSKEIKVTESIPFTHNYFYPGDYIISVDYYQNFYSNIPDASDKIMIKVVDTSIFISRVGDEGDFFVELMNNTNYDTDISGWILSSKERSFTLPRNTNLMAKKNMILSPKITNFSIADKDTLRLMTQQGGLVYDYGVLSFVPNVTKATSKKAIPVVISQEQSLKDLASKNESVGKSDTILLTSSVLNSGTLNNNVVKKQNTSLFIIFSAFIFISIGAGLVYFIRHKRVISTAGDDFQILDE